VTIRQLLTHHSGFNSKIKAENIADLKKLLNAPLAHPPGEVGEYENTNFYICRVLIEQIGNVEYTPYIKEHVLKPMGITRMETHFEAFEPTCTYQKLEDKLPGFPFDWNQADAAGAAGWYASVSDLGKFLNGIRDHKVLTAETTEMMFKDKLGWDSSDPCMMKNGGWFWNEGTRAGELHSVITHFPDDVDAVILTNCNPPVSVEELVVKAWNESAEE
jgi:CubicO group peptidase (beta-lactamase class C family)